jgi:hypothetical protein
MKINLYELIKESRNEGRKETIMEGEKIKLLK